MDWAITISGSGPDPAGELEGQGREGNLAQDHGLALAARDLVIQLRADGHDVERASLSAGHIRGGSIDLLALEEDV